MLQRVWTPYSKHEWEGLRNTIQTLQDPCSSHLLFLFLFFLFISFFSCDFITVQLYWRRASCAVRRSAEKKGVRDCGRKRAWQRDFLRTEMWMPKWEGRKRKEWNHTSSVIHSSSPAAFFSLISLSLPNTPRTLWDRRVSKYGPDEGSSGGTANRPADNQCMQVSWKLVNQNSGKREIVCGSSKSPYKLIQYNLHKYPPNNRFFLL